MEYPPVGDMILSKRDDGALLFDMLQFAEKAVHECMNESLESFSTNERLRWAVVKFIQIEASTRVSESTRVANSAVPWVQLRGMRNVFVHQYHELDMEAIWATVQEDLPPLIETLRNAAK